MGLEKLLEETEKAYYWIGYSFADATISYGSKDWQLQYIVTCKWSDNKHIRKLSKLLECKTSVKIARCSGKEYKQAIIRLRDAKILPKIIEKFNFKKDKTHNPPLLSVPNKNLLKSLLIGFIDGDGCVTKPTYTSNPYIKISCFKLWTPVIKQWLDEIGVDCKIYIYGNIGQVWIRDKGNLSMLKRQALKLPSMKRKWEIIK